MAVWEMADGSSWLMAQGSWLMAHGSWLVVHGAWCMVHGASRTPHPRELVGGDLV